MNTIENRHVVGSPRSSARYWHAHRICADCLDLLPQIEDGPPKYKALALPPPVDFASYRCQCYVCEEIKHCAVVEAMGRHEENVDFYRRNSNDFP